MLAIPQLLSPTNGAELFYAGCGFEEPVVLSWTAVPNATAYLVQGLKWEYDGSWVPDNNLSLVTSSTTVDYLPEGCTTYCWRVQATAAGFDPSGYSAYFRYRLDGFDESPSIQPDSCP